MWRVSFLWLCGTVGNLQKLRKKLQHPLIDRKTKERSGKASELWWWLVGLFGGFFDSQRADRISLNISAFNEVFLVSGVKDPAEMQRRLHAARWAVD